MCTSMYLYICATVCIVHCVTHNYSLWSCVKLINVFMYVCMNNNNWPSVLVQKHFLHSFTYEKRSRLLT